MNRCPATVVSLTATISDQGTNPAGTPRELSVIPASEIIRPGERSNILFNIDNPIRPKNTIPRQPAINIIALLLAITLRNLSGEVTKKTPMVTKAKQPKSINTIFNLLSGISIVSESVIGPKLPKKGKPYGKIAARPTATVIYWEKCGGGGSPLA